MNAARNNKVNAMSSLGPISWMTGKGLLQQIIFGLVIALVLYILLLSFETLYRSFKTIAGARVDLMPYNCTAESKVLTFEQYTCSFVPPPSYKRLPFSDNERTGAEFSYSFFLWINPSTFTEEDGLKYIFHKGYSTPFPLMGPGVFLKSNINTLRVYMNSAETWNNYVEVENIPVKKWVHIIVMARSNAIEVYINGNLTKKLKLENSVLYQNFQPLYVFNGRKYTINAITPSAKGESVRFLGAFGGNLSSLVYFNYALSYTEIDSLMREGPSTRSCEYGR